jgi:hypothetical protein
LSGDAGYQQQEEREIAMNELLTRLSSYNIFNYLLPGAVFAALSGPLAGVTLVQSDILMAAFYYYFVGLVISRFGSLVIEPILRRASFVKLAPYKDFVRAAASDPKIEVLSEVNNTYRTLMALFLLLLLLRGLRWVEDRVVELRSWNGVGIVVLLVVLFLFSYQKQTGYVRERVQQSEDAK